MALLTPSILLNILSSLENMKKKQERMGEDYGKKKREYIKGI